jgi:hypothetical protein
VTTFTIIDDDGVIYFSGNVFNYSEATDEDFNEILEFMESYGATGLIIDGVTYIG